MKSGTLRKFPFFWIGCIGLGILFVAILVYSFWRANFYYSNIQDALLYPYLFKHFQLHDVVVPSDHANILKYPLFWLQSLLPYNFTSLSIVDIGLSLLSILWWTALLIVAFGKKYTPIIIVLLASILFAGVTFHINFVETTVRNIEYPIGLSFIFIVSSLLNQKKRFSKLQVAVGTIVCLLFALAVSGDKFMLVAFSVPLVLVFIVNWIKSGRLDSKTLKAFGLVLLTSLVGYTILKLSALFGFIVLYNNQQFTNQFIQVSDFGPSFAHALSQLISLSGADIFGRVISPSSLIYIMNFLALIIGAVGFLLIVIDTIKSDNKKSPRIFILSVVAFSFFVTFFAYALSNLVLTKLPDGTLVDAYNSRYITLLPLLLIAGFIYVLNRFFANRKDIYIAVIVVYLLSIFLSVKSVADSWSVWNDFAQASRSTITNIVKTAKNNNVRAVVTADSLGAPIRFWSHGQIQYVSIINCTDRFPYNTSSSWGGSANHIKGKTALVVDTTGLGASYWSGCTKSDIQNFYGKPTKIVDSANQQGAKPIELWIYNYDVRSKLSTIN